jgi:hypothetical protein
MNPNRRTHSRRRARKRRGNRILHRAAPITLPEGDILQVPRHVVLENRRHAKVPSFSLGEAIVHHLNRRLDEAPPEERQPRIIWETPQDVRLIDFSLVDASKDPTLPRLGETGDDYFARQRELAATR